MTRKRLAAIEREIANIIAAIKQSIITETTKAELQKAEAEKARLEKAVNADTGALDGIPTLLPAPPTAFANWSAT